MAAGLPVIAPEIGGPRDLITPGHNGLFYTPGDDFHIRKRVLTLVNFEDMRLEMGRNAFATVQTRTWNAVCSELFALYTKVLAARMDKQQGHAS